MRLAHSAFLFCILSTDASIAQHVTIPDEVIQECNEHAEVLQLPDCLKNGALASETLQLAQSADFFGDNARAVVEACRETNDTFHKVWVCFRIAAEKAAETRDLIGVDKISDECMAGISNGEVIARLNDRYRSERRSLFPNEMFSGGTSYQPFRGCKETGK